MHYKIFINTHLVVIYYTINCLYNNTLGWYFNFIFVGAYNMEYTFKYFQPQIAHRYDICKPEFPILYEIVQQSNHYGTHQQYQIQLVKSILNVVAVENQAFQRVVVIVRK